MAETDAPSDALESIGALADPNRRKLYDFVVAEGRWVSRVDAAAHAGLQRSVAAHHLDRLADDGLLEVDYQRLSGRSGPGAGRPSKVYRRADRDFEVTLPPRKYELAGRLLADAIAMSIRSGADVADALAEAARAEGRRIGETMRALVDGARSPSSARAAAIRTLTNYGFEPEETDADVVVLRNCPFHHLARSHTELICGMNHCLIDAAIDELRADSLDARLEPDPETCCVRLHPR